MTTFKFQDMPFIIQALNKYWESMFVWQDESGRRWAFIKGHLWAAPLKHPRWFKDPDTETNMEYLKPMYLGHIGSYQCYNTRKFDPTDKWAYKWKFTTGGLDHVVNICPQFDCRDCKHLVFIDEEECGTEGGGIACRIRWNAGDEYLASDTYEMKGFVCKDFEPSKYRIKELKKRGLI